MSYAEKLEKNKFRHFMAWYFGGLLSLFSWGLFTGKVTVPQLIIWPVVIACIGQFAIIYYPKIVAKVFKK